MAKNKPKHRPAAPRTASLKQHHPPPGTMPGTLLAIPDARGSRFSILQYSEKACAENREASLDEVISCLGAYPITWINVEGLGNLAAIQQIGKAFHLHPLALEDVVSQHQRPKLEAYQELLFIVARMPHPQALSATEQVSFFLGPNFLITFQEGLPGDCFETVRQRIRQDGGPIRQGSAAFLLYQLLDTIVDQFFPQLEFHADLIQMIEDRIISERGASANSELYAIRRQLLLMHGTLRPLRDVVSGLMRGPQSLFDENTRWYLRDVYDHTSQLIDLLETYKDLCTQLMEMAAAAANARMNETMRFLTVMSAIFIPLTFVVGIYGMNFKTDVSVLNMPELGWAYGYPFSLLLMATIASGQLLFFRHKGWLGMPSAEKRKR